MIPPRVTFRIAVCCVLWLFTAAISAVRVEFVAFSTSPDQAGMCVLAQSIYEFSRYQLHLSYMGSSSQRGTVCGPINRNRRWPIDPYYVSKNANKKIKGKPHTKFYDLRMCKIVWMEWFVQVGSYSRKNRQYQEDDIIVFSDSYDVIVMRDLGSFIDTFVQYEKELNRSVIFAGDVNCWPLDNPVYTVRTPSANATIACKSFVSQTEGKSLPYRFPNSGTYVGRLGALRKLFTATREFYREQDDQALLTLTIAKHPTLGVVDRRALFFITNAMYYDGFFSTAPYGRKNSTVLCERDFFVNLPVLQLSGTRPYMIHVTGSPKPLYERCKDSFTDSYPLNSSTPVYDIDHDEMTTTRRLCPKLFRRLEMSRQIKRAVSSGSSNNIG